MHLCTLFLIYVFIAIVTCKLSNLSIEDTHIISSLAVFLRNCHEELSTRLSLEAEVSRLLFRC